MFPPEEGERKRKVKLIQVSWKDREEDSNKQPNDIQQRNLNIAKRNLTWSDICAEVKAVGKTKTTVQEVKRIRLSTYKPLILKSSPKNTDPDSCFCNCSLVAVQQEVVCR